MATTTISDRFFLPNGNPLPGGTIYILVPSAFNSGANFIPATTPPSNGIEVPIKADGTFTVNLFPTDVAVPPGAFYLVTYSFGGPPEVWTVPTSASPINLGAVRTVPTPIPAGVVALSSLGGAAGNAGAYIVSNGTSWVASVPAPVPSPAFVSAAQYAFIPQTPGGILSSGVPATITLAPVPLGVNGADANHYVYISLGTGTAEAVLITGGTAVSGSPSGTITFTPANNHSGAWTVSSATGGIQEAIIANPTCEVKVNGPTLTTFATVFIPANTRVTLGAVLITNNSGTPVFRLVGTTGCILSGLGREISKVRASAASGNIILIAAQSSTFVFAPGVENMTIDCSASGGSTTLLSIQTSWAGTYRNLKLSHSGSTGGPGTIGTGKGIFESDTELFGGTAVGCYQNRFENIDGGGDGVTPGLGFGIGMHLQATTGSAITVTDIIACNFAYNNTNLKLEGVGGGHVVRWTNIIGGSYNLSQNGGDGIMLTNTDQVNIQLTDIESNAGFGINASGSITEVFVSAAFANNISGNVAPYVLNATKYVDSSDHGGADRDTIIYGGSLFRFIFQPVNLVQNAHIGYGWNGDAFEIGQNLKATAALTGNLIDTSIPGTLLRIQATTGAVQCLTASVGANPRTLTLMWQMQNGVMQFVAVTAPGTPAAGFFSQYMDTADNKLKIKGPSGTVTVLGNP